MNKIFRSAFTVATIGTFTRLIAFFYKIFLSRSVGAEELGSYQIALSVFFTLSTLCSGGIPLALSRRVAASQSDDQRNRYVTSAVIICEVVAVVLCATIYLSPAVRGLLVKGAAENVLLCLMPALLSTALYSTIRARFWGMGNFSAYSFTETLEGIVRAGMGVLLIGTNAMGSGIIGASVAFVASDMISAIILTVLFAKSGGRLSRPDSISPLIKSAIPMTSVRFFAELTTSLTAILIPRIMIGSNVPATDALAEFGRMSGMVLPVLMIPSTLIGSLTVVIVPELASDVARGNTLAVRRKLNISLRFAVLIAALTMAVLLPLGKGIGNLLFGDERAGQLIALCAPICLVMNLSGVSASGLNSLGKERLTMRNYVIGATLSVLVVCALTARIGIYSMPLGMLASNLLTSALNLCNLAKISRIEKGLWATSGVAVLCALSASSVSLAASKIVGTNGIPALLICAVVSVATYLVLCSLLGVVEIKYLFSSIKKSPVQKSCRGKSA